MSERKIQKLQTRIRAKREQLKAAEIDKGGLTQTDFVSIIGWFAVWNTGKALQVAMRREGWRRRRLSFRWFYEGTE